MHNDILDSLYERNTPDKSTLQFRRNVIISLMFVLIIQLVTLAIQVIGITYFSKIDIVEIVEIINMFKNNQPDFNRINSFINYTETYLEKLSICTKMICGG
jgi:hypothetical protein